MFHNIKTLIAGLALTVCGVPLAAQTLDRSARPVPPPPARFVFPTVTRRTLPNGMQLAIVENHALPLVSVRVALPFDSAADPAGKEGLFALTIGMMREGTASMSGDQIAAAIGNLGSDVTPLRFTTVTSNVDRSFELLADMLMRPTFPEAALERRKAAQIAAIQRTQQTPAWLPRRVFYNLVHGATHPEARALSASDASVKSITRGDVAAFHAEYFRPENVTLVIAGDLTPAEAMKAVEQRFGGWKKVGTPYAVPDIALPAPRPTTIYLLDRPTTTQAYVFVGQAGPRRSSPDYFPIELMARVLGATSASRLQLNLRERHSYLYSGTLSGSVWRPDPESSLIFGSAALNQAKTDSALTEWIGEIDAIRGSRPPTDAELSTARASMTTALPALIETDDRVADRVAALARLGAPYDFDAMVTSAVAPITPAQVTEAAKRALDPAHLVILVAGDRKVLEPMLRAANIAPIVVLDRDGKTVP